MTCCWQDPGRGSKAGPQLQAVSLLLHHRLLSAYLAMPEPLAFAAEHETLSKLCAKALREGSLSGTIPMTVFMRLLTRRISMAASSLQGAVCSAVADMHRLCRG